MKPKCRSLERSMKLINLWPGWLESKENERKQDSINTNEKGDITLLYTYKKR